MLGSFTSDGGVDFYYYASSRNHFWYLLDAVLTCHNESFSGKTCKEIKKRILGHNGFAKLINDLKQQTTNKEKEKIRLEIRKRLIKYSLDICDLFKKVQVHKPKSNKDTNIIIEQSAFNELDKMIVNKSITIYCTSDYVFNELCRRFPQFANCAKALIAPTTNKRIKLEYKIEEWRKSFQ